MFDPERIVVVVDELHVRERHVIAIALRAPVSERTIDRAVYVPLVVASATGAVGFDHGLLVNTCASQLRDAGYRALVDPIIRRTP